MAEVCHKHTPTPPRAALVTVAAGQPRRDQQEGLQAKQAHGSTPQSNTMCAFALIPGRAAFTIKTKQTVADPKPFPMVGPLSSNSLPALLPSVFPFQDNVLTLGTPFLSPHTTFTEPFLLHRAFPSPVLLVSTAAGTLQAAAHGTRTPCATTRPVTQHLHAMLLPTRLTKKILHSVVLLFSSKALD